MSTIHNVDAGAEQQLLEALDFAPVLPCFKGECGNAATKRVACKVLPEHGYLLCDHHYGALLADVESSLSSGDFEITCHPCGQQADNFSGVADVIDI